MAIKKLYAVEDVKASMYRNPFFVEHEVMAVRGFAQAANDPQTEMYKYPDDFRLVFLADFDDVSGEFTFPAERVLLGFASRYKEPKNA